MNIEASTSHRRSSRQRLTLPAKLTKGDLVLDTRTVDISDTGVLLEKPKSFSNMFIVGEFLQLHIEGLIKQSQPKTSTFSVIYVRSEQDTIALEFI
ncbi:PilZ domain-containing protein [Kangiella sp. HZ709]|uniref:PilZ domain-containing protein n=1 Tax=Kangiella sp. HZ709 TaxID=2666328 RepID=UPI0012B0085D|nr:PilZ domain-containing protein [Kangiella sp. HZ709]MRX27667.1 hypothetical protein [Kangiella sp. HZ709]